MKKLAAVWDCVCWLLTMFAAGSVHRVVPHPYSMVVCAVVLLFNIVYMVIGRRLREYKTKPSHLVVVLETLFYVLVPIGGIILAIAYEVYGKDPMII